jgi:hypothetical protein
MLNACEAESKLVEVLVVEPAGGGGNILDRVKS